MFELYGNMLCVVGGWLYQSGIMTKANYDLLIHRSILRVVRRGCRNNTSLIDYASVPERFKQKIVDMVGDPLAKVVPGRGLSSSIIPDYKARTFFTQYKLADGRTLTQETINEYCINAEILNAIGKIAGNRSGQHRSLGGTTFNIWENLSHQVTALKKETHHTLPENHRRLKDKWEKYKKEGYMSLVHRGFLNDNSRKVSDQAENLILSLYAHPNKPYGSTIHDMYLQFLGGALELYDITTGEVLDRNDFFDKNGNPITISESTIWNYINMPHNRSLVDKIRSGRFEYINTHRPHYHRHAPFFSLSKISLDDRDLPRKMPDGSRVKAYYAYDVASGAVIGAAYSRTKDTNLFISCITNMFRFIEKEGLGIPIEVEVEHHIVRQFEDDLMKAGLVFPFVRWCAPGNSQEKRAEHFNRAKKYGYEKRYQDGIGRFYARLEANRVNYDKVPSADNDTWKEKFYSFEDLVGDDIKIIQTYNNDKHPKQNRYKGMTRLDVLRHHANPDAKPLQKEIIIRYIGEHRASSIRRNQYVRVQYNKYQLPNPEILKQLAPNNYSVDCYYLPEDDGNIPEVYMFQENRFVAVCRKIATFNEATAEQTLEDRDAIVEQSKYIARFDSMVKKGTNGFAKLGNVVPAENTTGQETPAVVIHNAETEETQQYDDICQYGTRGIDSL